MQVFPFLASPSTHKNLILIMNNELQQTRQVWINRLFSSQMSPPNRDLTDAAYRAAVAAAAYAIQSLEESRAKDETLTKSKSKVEDVKLGAITSSSDSSDDAPKLRLKEGSSTSSRKREPEKASSSFKKPSTDSIDETPKLSLNHGSTTTPKKGFPQKASSSFRKSVSFDYLTEKPEIPAMEKEKKPDLPLGKPPSFENVKVKIPEPTTTPKKTSYPPFTELPNPKHVDKVKRAPEESKADVWEREEMASIKEKYGKVRSKIDEWENNKKRTTNKKLEKIEAEMDTRRSKRMQSYRSKIKRIEEIARVARSQAEDNRRKEEMKVKEKANKIRLTGKIPATCFCF